MERFRGEFYFSTACICILDSSLFTWPVKSLVRDIFDDNNHCFSLMRDPVTQTSQNRLGGIRVENIIEFHDSKGRGDCTLGPESSRINEVDASNIRVHPQSHSDDYGPQITCLRKLTQLSY